MAHAERCPVCYGSGTVMTGCIGGYTISYSPSVMNNTGGATSTWYPGTQTVGQQTHVTCHGCGGKRWGTDEDGR